MIDEPIEIVDPKPKRKKWQHRTYDWPALKAEFFATGNNISLLKFAQSKGIKGLQWFYKNAISWEQERRDLMQRALEKAQLMTENSLAKQWSEHKDIWNAVKVGVKATLNRMKVPIKDAEGKETGQYNIVPPDPSDLRALAQTMESALKSERLIEGLPTENIQVIDTAVVKIIAILNREIPDSCPYCGQALEVKYHVAEGLRNTVKQIKMG